ncbi:MAG: PspC domain-containing protein [Flavobacteriales bacterium]
MKKTVTANISGTVFHIEEDAFLKLGRYLDSIRAKFTGTDGREEIMTDIEARIAELFQQRLEGRNVVSIADVEHVIGIMGQPEDYDTEEGAGTSAAAGGFDPTRTRKRLFRDPDDKWLGGVLGGVAAYLNMEVLWTRIIFLLLLFPLSFGSLAVVYVLMWILVPRADSTADRLQMRGEAVNVDNIKRVFEEGGERFKKGAEQMAGEARDLGKDWAPRGRAWGAEAASIARKTGRGLGTVLAKIIGVLFLMAAVTLLMMLVSALIGASWSNWGGAWAQGGAGSLDLGGLLFATRAHAIWFAVGAFILLAVPVVGLFIAGFRLLADTRSPRWLGWSLSIAWVAALILTIALGAGLGSDFHQRARNRTESAIAQPTGKVMQLAVLTTKDQGWSYGWTFDHDGFDWNDEGLQLENGRVRGWWAECDVERSPDSLYHLVVQREARGAMNAVAAARAEHITYSYEQRGDTLLISPILDFPQEDKFRGQWLRFILQVPTGGAVHLNEGTQHIIEDVDNVTDTWDHEMINRTWTMTARGLEDLDAPHERTEDGDDAQELDEQRLRDVQEEQRRADSLRGKPIAAIVFRGPAPKRTKTAGTGSAHPAPAVAALGNNDNRERTGTEGSALSFTMPNMLNFVPFLR